RSSQLLASRYPRRINVDCAGPVREDVPSHGLLGEGLTGENNRLKRGLKSRAPTIPLLSLRSCGGGVFGVAVAVLVGLLGEVAVDGALQRCPAMRRSVHLEGRGSPPDHFPFCPCELVDSLPHIVRLGES